MPSRWYTTPDARWPFRLKKHGFGMRGPYRHAHAQRIDAQVRQFQNLARLLAHFEFFARFTGAAERADLRDDVVDDRAFAPVEFLERRAPRAADRLVRRDAHFAQARRVANRSQR